LKNVFSRTFKLSLEGYCKKIKKGERKKRILRGGDKQPGKKSPPTGGIKSSENKEKETLRGNPRRKVTASRKENAT